MTLNETIQYAEENKLHPDIIKYLKSYEEMIEEEIRKAKSKISMINMEIQQSQQTELINKNLELLMTQIQL